MSQAENFGEALKRATAGNSVRELARRSGWARSTVHDWLKGTRVPNEQQLDDVLDAVEATPQSRRALHAQREECEKADADVSRTSGPVSEPVSGARDDGGSAATTVEPTPLPGGPGATPATPTGAPQSAPQSAPHAAPPSASESGPGSDPGARTSRRWPLILGALVAAIALFGGGMLLGRTTAPTAESAGEQPTAQQQEQGIPAQVTYTNSRGLIVREGPESVGDPVKYYVKGDELRIDCLVPDGETVDDPYFKQPSAVWAKLVDGNYVSDLYLDTPKGWEDSGEPPAPYEAC